MSNNIMDSFKLAKLKLKDDLGVEITYFDKMQNDENVCWIEKSWKTSIHRHPDMDNEVEKLKIHVARVYGLLAVGLYKDEKDFNKQEKKLLEDTLESIEITGVTMSGDDESRGISIIAKRKVLNGRVINMVTPDLRFDDEVYDFCFELGIIAREIVMEVYQYMFKRKFAQLELFPAKDADAEGKIVDMKIEPANKDNAE